jgi:hypothetical protein
VGYASDPPPDLEAEILKAATHLREQATQLFERGYRSGVKVGEAMNWHRLESFVDRSQSDVRRWLDRYSDEPFVRLGADGEPDIDGTVWEHWDDLSDDYKAYLHVLDEEFGVSPWASAMRSAPLLDGLKQALLDLWSAVRRPDQVSVGADASADQPPTPGRRPLLEGAL